MSAFLVGGLLLSAGAAEAQTDALKISGEIDGELANGERVVAQLRLTHARGFRRIQRIELSLKTNGVIVETLEIEPALFSVGIRGAVTTSFLDEDELRGAFFGLTPADVEIRSKGKELRLTIPIRFLTDPPPGSRLVAQALGEGPSRAGPIELGSPAAERSSITWTSVLLAAAVALFAGGVIGATTSAKRKPKTASVYGAVRDRMDVKPGPDAVIAPAKVAPAKVAPAKVAPARKAPAKKAPAKKAPAKKAPAKKAPAKKAPAKKAPAKKAPAKKASARGRSGGRTG